MAKQAPIRRLMAMNQAEWKQITIGIIASILQGALLPCYAILFGEYMKILTFEDDEATKWANLLALLFLVLGLAAGTAM